MKKKLFYFMILFMIFIGIWAVKAQTTSDKTIKKVISVVYDDSGSMNNYNEDWAYASYSFQNLIGLMNLNDELSVVQMSNPTQSIAIDLSNHENRMNYIKTIETWQAKSDTPFLAVETAVDWLKQKKNSYDDSQAVEFWLVVITDGAFRTGYPTNMQEYLNDFKTSMGNSKLEGILVAIGNEVPNYVKSDWLSVAGNHLITASNSNDIVNAMFEVSGLILGQGGEAIDLNITSSANQKEITFETYFPLRKFIIYQQNQNVSISNIVALEEEIIATEEIDTINPGSTTITSRMIHCESDSSDYIPAGKVTIQFTSNVDIDDDKFKILVEPAVNVELNVLDKAGNKVTDLNSTSFKEGDFVSFTANIISSIDQKPIDLKKWSDQLTGELVMGNQTVTMQYNPNDNTFYATSSIQAGSNLTYAVITLPGYFRAKSDLLSIYPKEVIDDVSVQLSSSTIDVSYKYSSEYEEIATFTYQVSGGTINGICNFHFQNLPKGIKVSVNGLYADEEGNLSALIYNDVPAEVKLYRNKDYTETNKTNITIDVTSEQYELQWTDDSITEIILNPIKRKITIEAVPILENQLLKLNRFQNKPIYLLSVLGDGEYLSKEELETLTLEYDKIRGIEFQKEIIESNGKYVLQLKLEKNLPTLFVQTEDITSNLTLTTKYQEKSSSSPISFNIEDSLTKYFLPLILILLIIFIIGYLPGIKKRLYPKKYCLKAGGEYERIQVKLLTRLIPYVSEKGIGSDLTIWATANKNKVWILNNFLEDAQIWINGELVEFHKKFELSISDELKVLEGNRETIYHYCQSTQEEMLDKTIDISDDMDDMFTDKKRMKKAIKNEIDDEFFS